METVSLRARVSEMQGLIKKLVPSDTSDGSQLHALVQETLSLLDDQPPPTTNLTLTNEAAANPQLSNSVRQNLPSTPSQNDEYVEPLLRPSRDRFILRRRKEFDDVWNMYATAVASFWTSAEVDLRDDMWGWDELTHDDKHFLKYVLAFFAAADGIVTENLAERFLAEIQVPEVRCFYGFQIAMESIHSEVYSLLLQSYVNDSAELDRLFDAIENVPSVKLKAQWSLRWINEGSFAERIIAFAAVEGIFFSGAFCAIFWVKKRGLLPGLTFSNELISRDEGLHTTFACLLYRRHIKHKLPAHRVLSIVKEAVSCEVEFVKEALPVPLLGMNAESMTAYVKFVADRLLMELGCEPHYGTQNPFEWMEMISLQGKTNFFERRVSEYQKSGVRAAMTSTQRGFHDYRGEFRLDADF